MEFVFGPTIFKRLYLFAKKNVWKTDHRPFLDVFILTPLRCTVWLTMVKQAPKHRTAPNQFPEPPSGFSDTMMFQMPIQPIFGAM